MRLGIDFGTTRVVVAVADRGNYPVVAFEAPDGSSWEWFPPLIAARGGERLYGWEAWAAQTDPRYTVVRSLKRTLEDAGPSTLVQLGITQIPMLQVLEEMMAALRSALLEHSSLPGKGTAGPLEATLGVPANANTNQRFLTVEPAMRAGFSVLGLLNEPSAASIEYGHRDRSGQSSECVLVYDFGGGTFDASLVEIEGREHTVVATEGVSFLGGDDFDLLLADLAFPSADVLTQAEIFRLHEECRTKKEAIHPNTRRIVIDLGCVREDFNEVAIPVDEFYERCRPLIQRTIDAAEKLVSDHPGKRVDAVYVTGGASELPLVSRMLREVFGRKVKRSPYTRSATAIGLAIQAGEQAGYVLRERFTRHFGVWREAQSGRDVVFDSLFPKGTLLPASGEPPLTIRRVYRPVHNIGHFRYLECSRRGEHGEPTGDITVWDEIRFSFDPSLGRQHDLSAEQVSHHPLAAQQEIEELYSCDAAGGVSVTISNLTAGYSREYRLGRWAASPEAIVPGKKKSRRAAK
jgi:molecular chaperone DnaK (HSP70)